MAITTVEQLEQTVKDMDRETRHEITKEMVSCVTAEDWQNLAKRYGFDISLELINDMMHEDAEELSDEELENVAGGCKKYDPSLMC